MEYLTVKEMADLKGCSERYIKKQVQDGKLEAIQTFNEKSRPKYLIPVSALPEELQVKYCRKLRADENAPPELKDKTKVKQRKNAVKRSFEEYSEAERTEINRWVNILEQWHGMRARYAKKTEFDPMFCAKIKLEQPDICISPDILYKKYAAYKEQDFDGLIDKRGGWNITETPNSHSTVMALRHAIQRCGLPMILYVDNGREFLTWDIGGKGHRTHKKQARRQRKAAVGGVV